MTIDGVEMKEEKTILSRTTCQQYLSLNSNGNMPRKIDQAKLVKIKKQQLLNFPLSIKQM